MKHPKRNGRLAPVVEPEEPTVPVRPLALRPREAAAALGISERLLWSMTKAGDVPCVRIGRAVVYPVASLEAWLNGKVGE